MKKRVKKLSLSRETIRHLQADDLPHVAGASGGSACCTSSVCLIETQCECDTVGPSNAYSCLRVCTANCTVACG